MSHRFTPFQIALAYALAGALYLLATDLVLGWATDGPDAFQAFEDWKGWVFLVPTTLALWLALRVTSARQRRMLTTALRAEDRLRMALTAAEGFLWQAMPRPDGRVAWRVSGGLARRLGLSESRWLDQETLLAHLHPEDAPALRDLGARIRAGSATLPDATCRLAEPGGRWRWVKIVPDPDSRGNDPEGRLWGVAFDISDQQRATQDLAEAIAGGELGTWRLDLDTGTIQINDRWAELIGHSRAGLGPVTLTEWRQLVHPDDLARLERSQAAQAQTGRYFHSEEIRMRHKEGHWVWILSRGRSVEATPGGRARVLAGVHVDIAPRKALEGALRSERDFLQGLAETSVSGILVLDAGGRVIFTNREAERILGVPAAQMLGRSHDDPAWGAQTLEGKPLPSGDFPFRNVIRSDRTLRDMRLAVQHPATGRRFLSVNAAPLRQEAGPAHLVCTITDITDRLAAEQELREGNARALHDALHDRLTGLPYRALFEDHLSAAIRQSGTAPLALILLDIDDFKAVNDRHGHEAGDRVIRQTADRLEALLRPGQILARLAGDEFGLLLPQATPGALSGQLQALHRVFDPPFEVEGQKLWLTASIGVGLHPEDAEGALGVWRNAELALREAKGRGRAQVMRFSGGLRRRLDHETRVAEALRRALQEGRFRLVLQPKVRLDSPARVVGAEVLLRCDAAELAGIGPDVFLPVAEKRGLIGAIDLCVVGLVGQLVQTLRARGQPMRLSMNLSPESLRHPDFGPRLLERLRACGLGPADVAFELTEGTVMDMTSCARDHVEVLLAAGFDLSADDFGTGYSSLSYLHRLRLSELKIDRSFVARLGRGEGAEAIVRAIVAMARALGLQVVAEGIETEEQASFLRQAGCEMGQGYLFGKGMEPEAFLARCEGWVTG